MHRFAVIIATLALFVSSALAVSTSHWTHDGEADFKDGTLHNVVVTSQGDVKLSRAVHIIEQQDPDVTSVDALAQASDGSVFAGTSPKGILLKIKDGKVTTEAKIADTVSIFSLLYDDDGGLLIGTGGDKGKIYRIDKPGDAPREIFSADGVQYIWAMQTTPDGNLYAATGPNGQLFEIHPDGSHKEVYKSSEDNLTTLLSDGKNLLYLGTDPDGLVVRFDCKTHESFVLYNASEAEITALAIDSAGNLYASTGEVGARQPQGAPSGNAKDTSGRPETGVEATPPIPKSTPAPPPKPPAPSNPDPNEPRPIPKQPTMLIPVNTPAYMMDDPSSGDDPGNGPQTPPDNQPSGDAGAQGAHAQPAAAQPADTDQAQKLPGNAIYKIDPNGFVTEIFRDDVVIYCMVAQGDKLIVGVGGEGAVYELKPAAEESEILAKVDAKQVTCLLPTSTGSVLMGLANAGGISELSSGYASDGTYISPVLDATQVSRFGNVQLHGYLPEGTSLTLSTRSGNLRDADAAGWSEWTTEASAAEYVKSQSPAARFLQYRLTFNSPKGDTTPSVDTVDVAYQLPNLPPIIKSVKLDSGDSTPPSAPAAHTAAAKPDGTGVQTITWDASDPNSDTLIYTLYFRSSTDGPWILLKDKLKDPTYEWDTRSVSDGRYQIKVLASDAPSNPIGQEKITSRVSDPIIVDNTPPVIGDVAVKITGNDAQITLHAQDATSIVANVEYTVDSSEDWQATLPTDIIFDSPDANVVFTVKNLTSGTHQVTIRATDSHGNAALQTVVVKIDRDAAQSH